MALLPLLLDDPFEFHRPSRILDQHFGLSLSSDDLLTPFTVPRSVRAPMRGSGGYIRPWRSVSSEANSGFTIQFDKKKIQANLDVQEFAPNEIFVKVTGDNQITVESKHEEKEDKHGYISRQFVRRYVLPKECDISKIESKLSSDGVLSITAPRTDQNAIEHKEVPITQTGKPSKPVEEKKEQK